MTTSQDQEREVDERLKTILFDLIEKHFPKGECKERGAAMVLIAEALIAYKPDTPKPVPEEVEKIDFNKRIIGNNAIELFNSFIEKWLPEYYPHLIDSDINDGQRIRAAITNIRQATIKEVVERVREEVIGGNKPMPKRGDVDPDIYVEVIHRTEGANSLLNEQRSALTKLEKEMR